jgi:PAS domain S-box-containing protein
MTPPPVPRTSTDNPDRQRPIHVLCVDDDPAVLELLAETLADAEDVTVSTTTDPDSVVQRLDDLDCVVSDYQMPGTTGLALLDAVRSRDSTLPFVLVTTSDDPDVVATVVDTPAADYLSKRELGRAPGLLETRIRTLVTQHRNSVFTTRVLAALEAVQDGVAIATPDGTIVFADRSFESRLGFADGDLHGIPWRSLFVDDEVAAFERARGEAIDDGWRWSGECQIRDADGTATTVGITVSGLDDGSRVFVVASPD